MGNKILYMLLSGLALLAWYWVGSHSYYAQGDDISTGYLLAAVLALAMGAGAGEGENPVEVIIGSITGSLPQIISVGAAFVVSTTVYELVLSAQAFNSMTIVHALAVAVASSFLISITAGCMRNSG